jgi:hypothetical protein
MINAKILQRVLAITASQRPSTAKAQQFLVMRWGSLDAHDLVFSAAGRAMDGFRHDASLGFLLRVIGVDRVDDEDGSATANQIRNNERHILFSSCGKTAAKYLLRERSQISSRMNCMARPPVLGERGETRRGFVSGPLRRSWETVSSANAN